MLAVTERGSLMSFLHVSKQRLATIIIMSLTLLMALGACAAPAATPTPTPSPTPTPTPVPDPIISLSEDSTFSDFVAFLSSETVSCLVGELGQATYDQLLDQSIFGDDIDFDGDLPVECFDQDTVISLVIAGLSQAAGGLTDATITCIRETFGGLDVASLAAITSGDISGGAMNDALGVGLGLLLCLNDDEASHITAGGIFGDIGGASDISLADVKCILQVVDLSQLTGLVESISSGTELDLSSLPTLLAAVADCGIDIGGLFGSELPDPLSDADGTVGDLLDSDLLDGEALPPLDLSDLSALPPETQVMVQCVVDALGSDNINGFLAGTYTPTLADIVALGGCNLDIAQLGDLESLLSP
jgi:hypothetical protein